MLAVKATRQGAPDHHQQARVALVGIVLGMLPLSGLTLIPGALGHDALVAPHFTILFWVFVPASFAYVILHYQLLGIRRLVHRGMVYGIVSVGLLALIAASLTVTVAFLDEGLGSGASLAVVSAVLVAGVLLFLPLHRGSRWLVDRLIYGDVVTYETFI